MHYLDTTSIESQPNWAEQTLRNAIRVGELAIHYQPIVNIRSGDIVPIQAEALFRWAHPEHGIMTPTGSADFTAFKKLMIQATDCVFRLAADQLNTWRQNGMELSMAVNLAGDLLNDTEFPARLRQIIEAASLRPQEMCLELTQADVSSLSTLARDTAEHLASLGFPLVLDNVGSGPMPVEVLADVPWAGMKIDRHVTQRLEHSERARNLVRGLVHLGHDLKMTVCTHGVERRKTLLLLTALGCDRAQGWYFGRPMPAEAFANALEQSDA